MWQWQKFVNLLDMKKLKEKNIYAIIVKRNEPWKKKKKGTNEHFCYVGTMVGVLYTSFFDREFDPDLGNDSNK